MLRGTFGVSNPLSLAEDVKENTTKVLQISLGFIRGRTWEIKAQIFSLKGWVCGGNGPSFSFRRPPWNLAAICHADEQWVN